MATSKTNKDLKNLYDKVYKEGKEKFFTFNSDYVGEHLIKILPPLDWDCIPCLESSCPKAAPCIEHISVESVQKAISDLLGSPTVFATQALP